MISFNVPYIFSAHYNLWHIALCNGPTALQDVMSLWVARAGLWIQLALPRRKADISKLEQRGQVKTERRLQCKPFQDVHFCLWTAGEQRNVSGTLFGDILDSNADSGMDQLCDARQVDTFLWVYPYFKFGDYKQWHMNVKIKWDNVCKAFTTVLAHIMEESCTLFSCSHKYRLHF